MRRVARMSSLDGVATWLGVTRSELDRLIERGQLRVVPPSADYRVHSADLDAYLATAADLQTQRGFWGRRGVGKLAAFFRP